MADEDTYSTGFYRTVSTDTCVARVVEASEKQARGCDDRWT